MVNAPFRARFDDGEGGMETFVAPGDHRVKAARLRLVSDAAVFDEVRHSEPAPCDIDERARLRKAVAIALLPSLALWALIWFALTCLITNWP
jgi:hypothetical protein